MRTITHAKLAHHPSKTWIDIIRSTWLPLLMVAARGIIVAGQPLDVKPMSSIAGLPSLIAFGSCGHQDKPQPILETVVTKQPDLFIYLGDNIYGDTQDMELLKRKYDKLGAKPEFRKLRATTPTIATWDDHDYGANDAGKEYPQKEASKQIFLEFWQVPKESDRYAHAGIYTAHRFTDGTRTLQVILLDTRTFRGEISVRRLPGGYALHDVTASGLTEEWPTVEPNNFRHGEVVRQNHFGMIHIDWSQADPPITMSIVDISGKPQVSKSVRLSELCF